MKTHWPNWLKFLVLVYFIVLLRTRYKEIDFIPVQCPFKYIVHKVSMYEEFKSIKVCGNERAHRHVSIQSIIYRYIKITQKKNNNTKKK